MEELVSSAQSTCSSHGCVLARTLQQTDTCGFLQHFWQSTYMEWTKPNGNIAPHEGGPMHLGT
jgi:hypothetical protein